MTNELASETMPTSDCLITRKEFREREQKMIRDRETNLQGKIKCLSRTSQVSTVIHMHKSFQDQGLGDRNMFKLQLKGHIINIYKCYQRRRKI